MVLLLLLVTGLNPAVAANVLTNSGFEDGVAGWDTNTWNEGAGQLDTSVSHSGQNSWKWNGSGATPQAWQGGRQLNVPVSDTKFYQYSAWVNVPTAGTGANQFGWTFRHNVGAGGQDLGYSVITAPGWTQVKAPIVRPAPGLSTFGYVGFHTLNYGGQTAFYVDDVAVEELDALILNGRVVNGQGAGVANASVAAASGEYTAPPTTTDAGGYYSLTVPPGTYSIQAGTPGFKGSTNKAVTSSPTTADDIVLSVDPDYDADLIFSAYSASIPATGPWPTASPAGMSLTRMNNATTEVIDGIQWEKNVADGPGWRFGGEMLDPIPAAGASAVVVVRMPDSRTPSNNWDSVLDAFYDQFVLGVRNDTGLVNVMVNGFPVVYAPAGTQLAEGQKAVLSLVAQEDGSFKVYINGAQVIDNAGTAPMTSLTPGIEAFKHYINVGRNDPDAWTTFNGYIGDVFLYKVALTDTKRAELEARLMAKFDINPDIYTISASVSGTGGKIEPSGDVRVPAGTDKTFTITAEPLHRIAKVVVDGVDMGPISSYTFENVQDDTHSIVAYFEALPWQIVSGKVTNGTQGIFGATVYFKTTPDATVNPDYTATTTTYAGDYKARIPVGEWYVNASAPGYVTGSDLYPVTVANGPLTQNITLTPLVSQMQPMLVSKGTGAAVTNETATVGYSFTTGSSPIEVSALGFVDWDQNGLASEHEVGIWSADEIPTTVTVPAGTAGNLVGDFRYVTVSPTIRLAPNTTYTIGGLVQAGGDAWPQFAPNPGLNPPDFLGITNIRGRSSDPDTAFLTEPATDRGVNMVGAAVNLIGKMVPPSTIKGVVKNPYGVGINSAVIQVGGNAGQTTVTDANGEYRLTNVPVGAGIELFADAVGFADHTETIDTSAAANGAMTKDITLTPKVEAGVGQNGGFENGVIGWSISNEQPGDMISTTFPGYSGDYAGKFTPGASNSWTWMHQIIDIVPGSVYTVTFKTYADPSVPEFFPMIAFRNDNGDELKGWISAEPGFAEWAHVPPRSWKQYMLFKTYSGDAAQPFVRVAPPADATKIDVWVGATGTGWAGASAYMDDVVIDRIGPDVANPPFTMTDVVDSMKWSSGLSTLPQSFVTRFDVETDGKVNARDSARILRKVTGLEANP